MELEIVDNLKSNDFYYISLGSNGHFYQEKIEGANLLQREFIKNNGKSLLENIEKNKSLTCKSYRPLLQIKSILMKNLTGLKKKQDC